MWNIISEYLKDHPERLAVAKVLVENGFSIREEKIYCNQIEIPAIRIAKAAKVDRRTVVETVKMIQKEVRLKEIFDRIRSAGLSLREIARYLGLGVIEITPTDPRTVGILAQSASVVAEEGFSIRQALVDDPELTPEPRLTLIVEGELPGDAISRILKIKGVDKVSIS